MSNNTDCSIHVHGISAFTDNYIWCVTNSKNNFCTLVDPGDAAPCIEFIQKNNLQLQTILVTHHHNDHIGGISQLREYCAQQQWELTVYGPQNEALNSSDIKVNESTNVIIEQQGISAKVLDIPGHTLGHIAYLFNDNLFCGDTLFSGGCGRVFEGTMAQMHSSLQKLVNLPAKTRVYCAHEYTLANIDFALTVDPNNLSLIQYYNDATIRRGKNLPTIPTSILKEKEINPFVRCFHPDIIESAEEYSASKVTNELEAFSIIRQWKNEF